MTGAASRRHRTTRAIATLALCLLAVLLPAAAAQAHDYLVTSTPAAGSTMRAPLHEVSLSFDDDVLNLGRGSTALFVTGPGAAARHYETTCAQVSNKVVSAAVDLGPSGRYSVTWRVVSADGHPVTSSIAFTYVAPAGVAPSSGSIHGPSCGIRFSSTDASDTQPAAPVGLAGVSIAIVVGGALLVLAVIAAVFVIAIRTRRAPADVAETADSVGPPDERTTG